MGLENPFTVPSKYAAKGNRTRPPRFVFVGGSRSQSSRYYQNASNNSSSAPTNPAALNAIFDQFRQPDDTADSLSIGGTMAYFEALDLQLDDPTVLALSKALDSPAMGEFTRKGFVDGWASLGADTLEKKKEKLRELKTRLNTDDSFFKEVYIWTFGWAKSPGQRALLPDTAIEWWKLLLAGRFQGHLDNWVEFIETKFKKSIPKDTWNMLYDFVEYVKTDPTLEKWDYMGSWPSVIDEYVEYYKELPK
ncbi:hypothetical protein H072_8937 [Dactylellina haptotyla CBS 200.50]|uniref:Defective in cullin neddylation protein n=1 Tax=Dactylellina haptotyla (strain CBS 200.50) TaxID=1284197 RepID=S8A8F9_DACHA|nr:hypothetical protein H072_8937 [Dactylellina haptotyla CBS 200.50]